MTTLILTVGGCEAIQQLFFPDQLTSVDLVNHGDFAVSVVLFISDEQDIPEALLTQDDIGTRLEFTVDPGQTVSFSRDCDELQAIIIEDADLLVIGQVGPETSTGVLRDGDEFGCGDTIVFTFDHSVLITDFDVSTSVM